MYSMMIVVDMDSAYNAILERQWLNEMKVVILTFHHTIKLLNGDKEDVGK